MAEDITDGQGKAERGVRLMQYAHEQLDAGRPNLFVFDPAHGHAISGLLSDITLDYTMGRKTITGYVVRNGRLTVSEGVATGPNSWNPGWRVKLTTAVPWKGPFRVFEDGTRRHYVASGGRVFSDSPDRPDGSVAETWSRSPVLAVITDADADTAWAFTKDEYFALRGPTFEPRKHSLGALPVTSPATEQATAYARAKFLRATRPAR